MGFGDPYHKHPLRPIFGPLVLIARANCFHCKLRITNDSCYGCKRCNFYIHKFCGQLPETMRHHLHHQHPLTLLTLLASSANVCNKCQKRCRKGFAYHCHTCQFILHLKCCFTLDHEIHHHPLHFRTPDLLLKTTCNCNICGYPIIDGFSFVCRRCKFSIHYDCSIIPPTIKHHHTHELAIRHDFPQECDQVYCDRCEDRDGVLDHTLSYYYCKECDYIAHVRCITQPKEDMMLFKLFTHEHPLRFATELDLLCCNLCDFSVPCSRTEYPSLIKHPLHPEHTLRFVEGDGLFKCTGREFALSIDSFLFSHAYHGHDLQFRTKSEPFRCDTCGELGNGSRISNASKNREDFDLHLECFALPGKLEHESHPCHTLYLSSNPAEDSLVAPSQYCSICSGEIDKMLWIYCCLDCDYVAHLTCVANDLLSTLRSSIKNEPGFCAIIEPDKTTFELHIAQIGPTSSKWPPKPLLKSKRDDDDAETKTSTEVEVEQVDGKVCCPRCNLQFSVIPNKNVS